ncbi:MAG: hypothetical protein LBV67_08675 [Streptococcaceae bacterium]|jgi:hypothetical protein|nr:hypothetical protein [Streptococcaceae bacterium]
MDELDNIDFFFCTEKDADNVLGIQLGMANVEELNFDLDNPHSLQALYHNRDNGIDKPEFNHRYKDNYIFGYDDYTFYGEKTENEPQEVVSELAVEDDIEYENDFVTPIERLERLLGTPNPIDTSWLDDYE